MISVTCALLNVLILVVTDAVGFSLEISVLISLIACVFTGYTLHSSFSFPSAYSHEGLLKYSFVMALNYPLTLILLWLLKDVLQLSMLIAALGSTAALTVYNYVSSRWAIRRDR